MQFIKPLAALLLTTSTVTAAPITRRDLSTISGVLTTITLDLAAMDAAVNKFDGDAVKAVPVLDAAEKTLADIKAGIVTVRNTDELGLMGAIGVLLPVGALYSAAKTLVADIVAKKPQFDSSFTTIIVQEKLGDFQTQAGKLVDVTIKKIPAYLSIISTPIAGSITGQLDEAAKGYGLAAGPQPQFASLTDAFTSLGSAFSSLSSAAGTPAAAAPAAPAPAPAASSGGFSLSSLFGGK